MSKKSAIQSEQEFVGIFLKESVGAYIQQKNNEHIGSASNEEVREWLKEDLGNLLDGLRDAADHLDKVKIDAVVEILKDNLDTYIDRMDKEFTHARDQVLLKENTTNPDPIKLDEALLKATQSSDLIKASQALQGKDVMQDTGWKTAANLFKKMGITPLANFFEKKNEQAKLAALKKSVSRYVPSLKGYIASDQKATSTPLPKSEKPKQQSR